MTLLHQAFEREARLVPDRVAVVAGSHSVTYGELYERSGRVAERLRLEGLRGGEIVAICAARSPSLVAGLLGILRAGCAYLPLDPENPPGRLASAVADAVPSAVLLDGEGERLVSPGDIPTMSLDWEALAEGSSIRGDVRESDLAYVMYTSGSTGLPKGVMCTHPGIVNRLEWMQDRFCIGPGDRVLHKTSIGFDVSLWELFLPLSVGAQLVLAPPGAHRHPELLGEAIRRHRVTILHFVPSMLRGFIKAGELESASTLRAVVCSGEALSPQLRDEFFARNGTAGLHNLYGPTEASVDVTHHHCRRDGRTPVVPIGRPITGVQIRVVDGALQDVSAGSTGEILIGGVAVARGYLGRPDLTAERFPQDPENPAGRLYRTGDLGRWLPSGELEYLGRNDDQVKVRGVRIELGEVEAVLSSHDRVLDCAVVAEVDGDSTRIAAFVDGGPDDGELRAFLRAHLPEQAVPGLIRRVRSVPRLASGKVDRSALAEELKHDTAPPNVAPQAESRAERLLAAVWTEVLGIPNVCGEDNFFNLGGDSLRSIEVVARARAAGLALSTEDVFRHQTLRAIAGAAEAIRGGANDIPQGRSIQPFALCGVSDRTLLPAGIEDAFPLNSLLSGLVAESESNPDYLVYTTTMTLRGEYEPRALLSALKKVVRRHPVLRSSIDAVRYGEPLQLVHSDVPVSVDEIDMSGVSERLWADIFPEWLERERRKRFTWATPPLFRLTVHQREGGCFQLTLSEPYLDGWSATMMLTELLSSYRAALREEPVALPAPPAATMADQMLAEQAAVGSLEHRRAWEERLAGATPTLLPRHGKSRTGGPSHSRIDVPLTQDVSDGLRAAAHSLGVPLKSVLLAAHVHATAALTGQDEVLCGLMVNGRPEVSDGHTAIGMFLNTVPLRVRVGPGSWNDLVLAAHAAEADALPWRLYPYGQILRERGGRPLFESIFNFTDFRPYREFANGSDLQLVEVSGSDQTYIPLTAQASVGLDGKRVRLALEINPDGFTAFQIAQIADLYSGALEAIAGRSDASYLAESLIGPRERRRRARWASPYVGEQPPRRIDDLFKARAAATPDALAVFDRHSRRTFAELDEGSATVGRSVLEACREAPLRVGVCMERSPQLVEALLAVLKIGAAYVPLDPSGAPRRAAHIIDDAGLDIVLVDSAGQTMLEAADTGAHLLRPDRAGAPGPCPEAPTASPKDPAHIIYTSGSTGTPKGVVTSHATVVNRLRFMWQAYPYSRGEIGCLRGSIAFVDSVAELFGGLLCGTPTFLLEDGIRDPRDIAAAVAAAGVTRLTMVPSLLRQLLEGLDREEQQLLSGVTQWTLSGEPLSAALVDELQTIAPTARVLNLYGSTEVAGDVTAFVCQPGNADVMVPAGRPIAGATIHVVDRFGREVPLGATGEVAIGGEPLAIGYLNDPELTAERFRRSLAAIGGRLFHTGDAGRRRPDGTLELLGRMDRQIKVNGVRIEPSEVEAALLAHSEVRAAAVVSSSVQAGVALPPMIAFVETAAPPDLLRAHLLERLPTSMVPGVFVPTEALPRTDTGKIDYPALDELTPAVLAVGSGVACGGPETSTQEMLVDLWERDLHIDGVGLDDDFFELGGHSLVAARLIARIRRETGTALTLRDIFDNPTVRQLAVRIEDAQGHHDRASLAYAAAR
jgi:amino acid adenylation domain-containing protein